jgi:amino acid transporter
MLSVSDVDGLITYSTFVESFFTMLSVAGLLWLRYKKPKLERPIRVNIYYNLFQILHSIIKA